MIIVLIISAIVSGIVGVIEGEGITDTIIILIVIIVNAIIGVAQENKAEKSLEALQKLSSHAAKVIRDGKLSVIPSKDLFCKSSFIKCSRHLYFPSKIPSCGEY